VVKKTKKINLGDKIEDFPAPEGPNNPSEASREVRIRECAVLDWSNIPTKQVQEQLDLSYQTVANYRDTDIYKATIEELRSEWMKEMMRLPGTADLKKKISQGMALSLNALIDILSTARTAAKDKIGAARLMAQLDGRFLKGEDEEGTANRNADSIAQELLTAINRQDTVN
jgi:hypothetical protein